MKKEKLNRKEKFALKLIKKEQPDKEIQHRLKVKFGTEISDEKLEKLKAVARFTLKESPVRYFEQEKKRGYFLGDRRFGLFHTKKK
ncbi:MAG: hypothetical protein ACTSRK_14595 [Promethearchaeota archaeon]